MKKHISSRGAVVGILSIMVAAVILFGWQNIAKMQGKENGPKPESRPTIHPNSGSKHVNFTDGYDLDPGNAVAANVQPITAASADFDGDGFADMVTADINGHVSFYKGRSLVPLDLGEKADLETDKTGHSIEDQPFTLTQKSAYLGVSPDFFFAGDFNADGHPDLIAMSRSSANIVLAAGDGTGNFSVAQNTAISGRIISAEAGEIGHPDGQSDLVVAYSNEKGSYLAVFEHPEGAFKHPPEILSLPSEPNAIAIGNLDEDFYKDIAVACGSTLVVVHERGQVYPWDIINDSEYRTAASDRRDPPDAIHNSFNDSRPLWRKTRNFAGDAGNRRQCLSPRIKPLSTGFEQ